MVRWDEMLRWGIEQITGTNILFFVILLWYILKARQCRFWFGLWYSNQILMHQKGRGSRYRVARNKVCWCVCDVIRLWRWRRREKDERRWEFIFYVIYFWPLSKMGIWFFCRWKKPFRQEGTSNFKTCNTDRAKRAMDPISSRDDRSVRLTIFTTRQTNNMNNVYIVKTDHKKIITLLRSIVGTVWVLLERRNIFLGVLHTTINMH